MHTHDHTHTPKNYPHPHTNTHFTYTHTKTLTCTRTKQGQNSNMTQQESNTFRRFNLSFLDIFSMPSIHWHTGNEKMAFPAPSLSVCLSVVTSQIDKYSKSNLSVTCKKKNMQSIATQMNADIVYVIKYISLIKTRLPQHLQV